MLQWLDSADDVLALRVSDKITGADLDAIMDRVDQVMPRQPKLHVFVEAIGIEGIDVAALPTHAARAWPLFGKLDRFGRVAVVADQAWVRAGTRLESAILPSISYRVCEPEEREEALSWVEGRSAAAQAQA
jgi:hypothetical protein